MLYVKKMVMKVKSLVEIFERENGEWEFGWNAF